MGQTGKTDTWAEFPASHHNSPLSDALPPALPKGKGNNLGFPSLVVKNADGWAEMLSYIQHSSSAKRAQRAAQGLKYPIALLLFELCDFVQFLMLEFS